MTKPTKIFIYACLCLLLAPFLIAAQNNIDKHVPLFNNSLPVKIKCIYKTKQGIIYVGTEDGLYKFDGAHYRKIKFKDSVIIGPVSAIFENEAGEMWVGYVNGSIAQKINNKLQVFNPEEGTPQKTITAFLKDKENDLWFSTDGEGIYYFKGKHLYNINSNDGLSDEHVHAMQLTSGGDVIAATDQGLNICAIHNLKKNITVLNSTKGLPDNLITCIAPAEKDYYWIGMQDKGYCLYNHSKKTFTNNIIQWEKGQINALDYSQNCLHIATENEGFLKVENPIISNLITEENINTKYPINAILSDNEGNIWMSSYNDMIRTNGQKLQLVTLPDTKSIDKIRAIMVDNKNHLWIAYENTLIQYSNTTELKQIALIKIPGMINGQDITSVYQDKFGTIWIGTMGEGIFLLNPDNNQIRKLKENPLLIKSNILSISGKKDVVNVSSFEGISSFILTDANKSLLNQYYYFDYKNNKNIGSNYVYSIFTDSRNRLWFATDGKGITVLDKGIYTNYNENVRLKNSVVYSITEDKKGNIWFTTEKAGVYKFDGKTFTNFSTAEGLSNLNIANIKTDIKGNIIIVSNKGIDILNPETYAIASFNHEQGINLIKEDPNFVTEDTSNNILFCTDKGIGIYNPVKNSIVQPQTYIENINLFLEEIGPNPSPIFKYDQNNLTFRFFGIYYSDPEKVQYQYQLEGYDNKWFSTRDNEAPFAKLPPGNYTFRVRSSLNDSFKNANEAVFEFTIQNPIWRRWWFILILATTMALIITWYVKRREKHLKNIEQLNQEKIHFQFQELRNQINPHFLFNSFNTLISVIESDPKAAVEYTENLSDFFRNIVTYKDKDIITLKEEIELMKNYLFMQQKRYGNNLQFNVQATETEQETAFIPPLTLQLLTENAIKHNAISKEKPLLINIFIENDRLIIKNNINKLINKQEGTGTGLLNIVNRYNLLSHKKVIIEKNDNFFVVSMPILKKQHE